MTHTICDIAKLFLAFCNSDFGIFFPGMTGKGQLEMSLCKQQAFVLVKFTPSEALSITHWTTGMHHVLILLLPYKIFHSQ